MRSVTSRPAALYAFLTFQRRSLPALSFGVLLLLSSSWVIGSVVCWPELLVPTGLSLAVALMLRIAGICYVR